MSSRQINNSLLLLSLLAYLLMGFVPILQAAAKISPKTPEQCVKIVSALERLECFDAYFKSPVYIRKSSQSGSGFSHYPDVLKMALRQERQRNGDSNTLLQRSYAERNAGEQQRVMLTAPALAGNLPRPLLIISCVQNITRFQIGLKRRVDEGEVRLRLELDGRQRYQDYLWRVVGNDYLVDAGRGLPGIEFIKTLFHHERLKFHSDNARIDGLTFDISMLSEKIKPLRTSCHW